jgi:hypothetical protein
MSINDWPESFPVAPTIKSINISALARDEKKLVWDHLLDCHPKKAEEIKLLMSDQIVLDLMAELGGEILLEVKYLSNGLRYHFGC